MTEKHEIPATTRDEAFDTVRSLLRQIRSLADRVEQIMDGVQTGDMSSIRGESSVTWTKGGSIKNLGKNIVQLIDLSAGSLTSEQIARTLYKPEYGLSYDLFKRRVIVTVSALSRSEYPQVVQAVDVVKGKEKQWTLPSRKHEGHPKVALHDTQSR